MIGGAIILGGVLISTILWRSVYVTARFFKMSYMLALYFTGFCNAIVSVISGLAVTRYHSNNLLAVRTENTMADQLVLINSSGYYLHDLLFYEYGASSPFMLVHHLFCIGTIINLCFYDHAPVVVTFIWIYESSNPMLLYRFYMKEKNLKKK